MGLFTYYIIGRGGYVAYVKKNKNNQKMTKNGLTSCVNGLIIHLLADILC